MGVTNYRKLTTFHRTATMDDAWIVCKYSVMLYRKIIIMNVINVMKYLF